ncbi:hypothetical protein O3G_MSEX005779 [Manduca sexta]|uniref:Cuticle protein n=1 Tax=Manduca sexta TaxID=7130 RepID=A0A922CKL6_MANSE|nr:hypothetical protein O3G_MSEX005779 [Manduca sexta]KAG6448924.1 hypothetical protein O3G_MSEX005779 [Manduca sexta]
MAAKFFAVLSLAVAASALPVVPLAKIAYAEAEAPAHYEFAYSVRDDHSGDIKEQKETREGYAVHGSYSLVQPDGVHRIVDYTADKENGFNAVVRYEGQPIAEPAKIAYAAAPVAKVAYAAPVAKVAYAAPVAKIAYAHAPVAYAAPVAKVGYAHAPVAYAAPIAKVAYAAPVAKIAYDAAPLAHVAFSSPAISYHH